ncbi:MAG: protein kinase [Nannocystis sp.]|nr:protein kinase [Nannocystis sp.]
MELGLRDTERYTIIRQLGVGGFGVVYEALDRITGERVALKTLRELHPEALYRLKREFRALADVEHPNLVSLLELAAAGDEWFLTMELIEGVDFYAAATATARAPFAAAQTRIPPAAQTRIGGAAPSTGGVDGACLTVPVAQVLAQAQRQSEPSRPVLEDRPRADPDALRPLLRQLVEGVHALHRHGMLHRDLKPSNVLVSGEGRVVILDFGLVTETQRRRSLDPQLLGTIEYMAPEQAAGEPATAASDWYSVGVMLFEALTGALPFEGSLLDTIQRKVEEDAPPVRALVPDVPEDISILCDRLLARDPRLRPSEAELLGAVGSASAGEAKSARGGERLLGRARELAALTAAAAASREGKAVLVFLRGPAGVGRTALLDTFVGALPRDAVVLRGRCYERESVPYKAIDGLIDALGRYLLEREQRGYSVDALLPLYVRTLARLFPVLRRVPAIERARSPSDEAGLAPDELRQRGFEALRQLLSRLAGEAGITLILDDLHWGDSDSAALLAELLAPPDPPSALIIAGFRGEAASSPCLALLSERARPHPRLELRELPLGLLTLTSAHELASILLAGSGREAEAEAIARESGGSPLYLAELCRFVRESEPGEARGGGLEAVLAGRLSRLRAPPRALLELVAVAGQPIATSLALAASGADDDARAAVAELRLQRFVRTESGQIEPFHERVRAAVLSSLSPAAARALHLRLADALERAPEVDVELLTTHLTAAGEAARAARYAALAAERAARALAFERAAELYRLALAAPLADVTELQVALGEALANAGRGAEAAAVFLAAATEAGEPRALDLRRRAGFELLRSGRIDDGITAFQRVLASAGMRIGSPTYELLRLLRERAALRLRGLGFRERDEATIPAEQLHRADVAWSVGASGLGMVDDIAAGRFQSQSLRLSLEAGELTRVARALAGELAFSAVGGRAAAGRTERLLHTARRLVERLDQPLYRGILATTTGIAAYLEGRFRAAIHACDHGERLLRGAPGAAWDLVNARLWRIQAQVYLGDMAAVGERLPALLRDAERRGDLYLLASLRTSVTHLHWLARDLPDEAAAGVEDASARWSTQGFQAQHYWQLHARCNIDLYRGDPASALGRVEAGWPQLAKLLRIEFVAIEAWHLRARCLLAAGRGDAELRPAIRRLKGKSWAAGFASILQAAQRARAGDRPAAARLLADAIADFEANDMALYAAIARRRRGELLGGDQGAAMIASADTWLIGQGVRASDRLMGALAPGFG